ncbi:hypothetical protein D917_01063, partial [Trichinella nativa]
ISIKPDHPSWYGAWWIGFLITGMLSFLVSFPLSLFDKEFNGFAQKFYILASSTQRCDKQFLDERVYHFYAENFPKCVFNYGWHVLSLCLLEYLETFWAVT